MDSSWLMFLILMVMTPSESSEADESLCQDLNTDSFNLLEGEALYFEPDVLYDEDDLSDNEFVWYKNNSQLEPVSTDKNERVHYQGSALFFLNIHADDSGSYIACQTLPSGKCYNHYVKFEVFEDQMDTALFNQEINNSDRSKKMTCPDPVSAPCEIFNGTLTWMKNFTLLQGRKDTDIWINHATENDEGIYTCVCNWTYNDNMYKTSGSRRLVVRDPGVHRTPQIISPTQKRLPADEGFGTNLTCSVLCGTNVKFHCKAYWQINGIAFNQSEGYSQITTTVNEDAMHTFATAVLTIEKVTAKHFQDEFKCIGEGFYETASQTFTLVPRESIIPLLMEGVCVLVFFVLSIMLVKCFAIDLTLLFRRYFPLRNHNKDTRVFDAYVVYETQPMDQVTEDTLCQFITKTLPSVLEEKCGYRLFIHGRDDIPGEDHLELVEDRMRQSRRLMAILTPGSTPDITDQHPSTPQNLVGGFDWQVGLHHVLVRREISVILIQLGDTGPEGYTRFPPGLQHLILQSAPIRWPEGSRGAAAWNSCFWKKVRYLMPATPARKCRQSAII